jgi:hypothetical protein
MPFMRTLLTFFSMLAFGVLTAAAIVAIMPWLSGQMPSGTVIGGTKLHFDSLLLGMVLGLILGTLGRYNWGEIPRRVVTWVLIRERQFFYYVLIGGCVAVLVFY